MNLSIHLQPTVILLTIIFITACSNKASTFVAAPADDDKGSVVYIYRPSSSANFMMTPKVIIDENEKFEIGSGDYRYVYLPAGLHTVGLNPTDRYITDAAVRLNVETGKSYYLRINTSLKFETEKMNTRKFWIENVAEKQALTEISNTTYSGPELQPSSAVQTERSGVDAGFSVDKTQDPFAGKN